MSILRLLTSVSLAAFTVAALHGEKGCPGDVPSVPLKVVRGALIVVPVTVNGSGPYEFLVDSGGAFGQEDDITVLALQFAP